MHENKVKPQGDNPMNHIKELERRNRRNTVIIIAMIAAVILVGVACLFVGSSNMSFSDAMDALLGVAAMPRAGSSGRSVCPEYWRPLSPARDLPLLAL